MVAKCANPVCGTPLHYFRGGRLFLIDGSRANVLGEEPVHRTARTPEYFWLCEQCCATMAIDLDNDGRASVISVSPTFCGAGRSRTLASDRGLLQATRKQKRRGAGQE